MNPDNEFKINIKGVMTGNGVTNWRWDGDPSWIKSAYYFNIYGMDYKKKLEHYNCTFEYMDREPHFFDPSPEC